MGISKAISDSKISVIVPLYNGEVYIEQTLEYILSSNYNNLEVIVINDGSKDEGYDIARRLEKKDYRIKIYSKENGGIISARNYGIERATGEYLCFCDQDDFVDKNMYTKMIQKIEADKSDFCMCSTGRMIEGQVVPFENFENQKYQGDEINQKLLYPLLMGEYNLYNSEKERRYPHIWKCLIKKDFFIKHNLRFKRFIDFEDDLLMLIELLLNAETVSTVSDRLYVWRVNFQSETYNSKYFEDFISRYNSFLNYVTGLLERDLVSDNFTQAYKKVVMCRMYIDLIDNLYNGRKKGKHISIKQYLDNNIYIYGFQDNIKIYPYLKKGHIKPKIVLKLLSFKTYYLVYFVNVILEKVKLFTLRYHWISKIERKMKMVKNKD